MNVQSTEPPKCPCSVRLLPHLFTSYPNPSWSRVCMGRFPQGESVNFPSRSLHQGGTNVSLWPFLSIISGTPLGATGIIASLFYSFQSLGELQGWGVVGPVSFLHLTPLCGQAVLCASLEQPWAPGLVLTPPALLSSSSA